MDVRIVLYTCIQDLFAIAAFALQKFIYLVPVVMSRVKFCCDVTIVLPLGKS